VRKGIALYGNKRRKWNKVRVIQEIQALKFRHSTWVKKNNNALWKAGVRYFDSWKEAIIAAGYNYDDIKQSGPTGAPPNKGAGGSCKKPGCNNVHHARGFCKRCYSLWSRQESLRRKVRGPNKTTN